MAKEAKRVIRRTAKINTKDFVHALRAFETAYPRREFPWRKTTNPYRIAVSEIMLQQTQADRVVEKYTRFLKTFPTVHALAAAPVSAVLAVWTGLGYNRRALYLKKMAQEIVARYRGVFPETVDELEALPGIGPYTARAIAAFAYNEPNDIIETNIRTVFIHHFFPRATQKITDEELRPYIRMTMDHANPRAWYNLLMDYGSFLKKNGNSAHRKSRTYVRQKPFAGSRRATRGAILRLLQTAPLEESKILSQIHAQFSLTTSPPPHARMRALATESLLALQKDGFIISKQTGKKTIFSITSS